MALMENTSQIFHHILGDFAGFYEQQYQRLLALGIDIRGLPLSHLAFRTKTIEEYLEIRNQLEPFCSANVENIWGGRPISKMELKTPLVLSREASTSLIELIPPEHADEYQDVYKLGLEHIGIVLGEEFENFGKQCAPLITGQQDQGPFCNPFFITFEDQSNVKFYLRSLKEVCILEGKHFDGFYHAIE